MVDRCLDPDTWRRWGVTLVEVHPHATTLIHRGRYTPERWAVATGPVTHDGPMWWSWADVAAATLADGRAPRIARAVRLDPDGRQDQLRKVRLRGGATLDPAADPFVALVAARRAATAAGNDRTALALKVAVNSLSHGLSSRLDELPPTATPSALRVWAGTGASFEAQVDRVERPGPWSFPPIAATVGAGARLALALIERMITDAGGAFAWMDTDSIGVVATTDGSMVACAGGTERTPEGDPAVRALSRSTLEAITERFAALNPFDHGRSPWQPKASSAGAETFAYVVGPKRYCLYRLDSERGPQVVGGTEHGLGGIYLDPTGTSERGASGLYRWVDDAWRHVLAWGTSSTTVPPGWAERLAVRSDALTTPGVLARCSALGDVRPFNFALAGQQAGVAGLAGLVDADGADDVAPVAPYTREPTEWEGADWRDRRAGQAIEPTDLLRMRGVLAAWQIPDDPRTERAPGTRLRNPGLVTPRPVTAAPGVVVIGKGTAGLDDAELRVADVIVYGRSCVECGNPLDGRRRDQLRHDACASAVRSRAYRSRRAGGRPAVASTCECCGLALPVGSSPRRRFCDGTCRRDASRNGTAGRCPIPGCRNLAASDGGICGWCRREGRWPS